MAETGGSFASLLRQELCWRNRQHAVGRAHVQSYGSQPVIVYEPEEGRHGNFFDPAYAAIAGRADWLRRFDKIHAQGRALPKAESGRRWRELDSSMSSDSLLMNIFCTPGVAESSRVRTVLGVTEDGPPVFGWKARVPLLSGRVDRTEVDMRFGSLLVEAKLTESDFQTQAAPLVEAYRDLDAVFDRERLPRIATPFGRRKEAFEFPEDYSQELEDAAGEPELRAAVAPQMLRQPLSPNLRSNGPFELRYVSYQLIRNVLAAYAHGCSFCVLHDERRPDLREAWFAVMAAVRDAEMRVRLQVLTWQELAALLPRPLQEFLESKYGITARS
ncbi:MAG TPA: hypothetical protein VHZ52_05425 [Acidobacteriaceae bacterium]|jgi:hypothetical protein|nr:hypothetical protein [Acidobacteriaceae bacterium]